MLDLNYYRQYLTCQDCGAQPDCSNLPYSLSNVWVIEYEDSIYGIERMFCTCAACATFYNQSPDCRVTPLENYELWCDLRRIKDVIIPYDYSRRKDAYEAVRYYMWAIAEAKRAERTQPNSPRRSHPTRSHPTRSRRPLPLSLRYSILQRDGFRCKTCGRTPEQHGVVLHVDHILAVVKGGTNDPGNLRALCAECNLGKGDR